MDIDLNLLKVLDAVARMRSVSAAAAELQMSQPGVSSALARLRVRLGDQLLVRSSNGMMPTPFAEALVAQTRDFLVRLNAHVGEGRDFEPASSDSVFRLAMSDIGEMSMVPALIADLKLRAPSATLHSVSLPHGQLISALEQGMVDLAVGYMPDLTGAGLYQQRLFDHGFSCLMRAGHRLAERVRLRRSDYEDADHVAVHTPVRSQDLIDRTIEQKGIRRRIVMHTPHFMSLPVIIAQSDLIATVPSAVGSTFVDTGLLVSRPPPFASPRFAVKQYWHRRFHDDPRNRWLRQRLADLMKDGWSHAVALPSKQ